MSCLFRLMKKDLVSSERLDYCVKWIKTDYISVMFSLIGWQQCLCVHSLVHSGDYVTLINGSLSKQVSAFLYTCTDKKHDIIFTKWGIYEDKPEMS